MDRQQRLKAVRTWMYQLQGLEDWEAVEALAASEYDLLVIEPGFNFTEYPYKTGEILKKLRFTPSGKKRLILAYIDIGQAEDYRDYWQHDWIKPSRQKRGEPDFLITIDPDGWSGNYPVAYWQKAWQKIWTAPGALVEQIVRYGFDGIYLDWVEAYDDEQVRLAAQQQKIEPGAAMINFIALLRKSGRRLRSDFLVVSQNAPYLIDHDPAGYVKVIDGLAVEDTWYHGRGDAGWNSPLAGDLRFRKQGDYQTSALLKQYQKYQNQGLPVFSVDYCLSRKNARQVYRAARQSGLIPLVSRVSLSRMTETPPYEF